jgi:hypothetical protein
MEIKKKIIRAIKKNPTFSNKEIADKVSDTWQRVASVRVNAVKNGLLPESANITESKSTYVAGKYTNEDGENKELCRDLVVTDFVNSGVVGTILSLSSDNCIVEKKITSTGLDYNFICPEKHRPTFRKLQEKVASEELPIVPYYGKFSDKLFTVDRNTYAHIFADYCGSLETHKNEIKYIFDNNLVRVGGYIAITVSVRGTLFNGNLFDRLGNVDDKDKRCKTVKGVEAYFNRIVGLNYGRVEIFQYNDTKDDVRKQEMLLIRVRRIE